MLQECFKRKVALLMSLIMIFSMIPFTAGAFVFDEDSVHDFNYEFDSDYDYDPWSDFENYLAESVIFNLGSREVMVGHHDNPFAEHLFDADGSFTIQLEDNAFFPYEIQFQRNGVATTEWFRTPQDTVVIDGYTFGVYSAETDSSVITQIGAWVGGEYFAAYPEEKEFTHSLFMPLSLLPLEERSFWLPLYDLSPPELSMVRLETIFSSPHNHYNSQPSENVVWARVSWGTPAVASTAHEIIGYDHVFNLTQFRTSQVRLEMLVGDTNQLNPGNIRYLVNVGMDLWSDWLDFEIFNQARQSITVHQQSYSAGSIPPQYNLWVSANDIAQGEEVFLGMNWGSNFTDTHENVNVRIFHNSGQTQTADLAPAQVISGWTNVTNAVWNQNMSQANAGLLSEFSWQNQQHFAVVLGADEEITGFAVFVLRVIHSTNSVQVYDVRDADGNWISYTWVSNPTVNGVQIFNLEIPRDINQDLRLSMFFNVLGSVQMYDDPDSQIARAVVGHFTNAADINARTCIAAELFSWDTGFLANYSGNGRDFTMLDTDGGIHRFTVRFEQGEVPKPPEEVTEVTPNNPGSNDTFFRVTGAAELAHVYVMPYQHDTYFNLGYQTVFFIPGYRGANNDVDISSLRPTFQTVTQGVNIYAGTDGGAGQLQESGRDVHNFSEGPVLYSAAAASGIALRNYTVSFVSQTSGASLFVNGIDFHKLETDKNYTPTREIYFNPFFGDWHDIFIANVGDQPLTGLNATLSNAQAVQLCDYWTVGGENNDTLAAFLTTTRTPGRLNGELSNVAKIRLRRVDGQAGLISGTLTITANELNEPLVITLTGEASGSPRIVTSSLHPPIAVRHVPYAALIQHNNRYPDNVVTLSIVDWDQATQSWIPGSLPAGLTLRPNGEIYGTPTVAGTFNVNVRMQNSYEMFEDHIVNFELVINDNTDEFVDATTSPGYELVTRLPNIVTRAGNVQLISAGEFAEFVDVWLNGVRLTRGVQYTVREGTTRVTLNSQAFDGLQSGRHTVAVEFRTGGSVETGEMRRAAQNFTLQAGGTTQQQTQRPQQPAGGAGGGALRPIRPTAVAPSAQQPGQGTPASPVVTFEATQNDDGSTTVIVSSSQTITSPATVSVPLGDAGDVNHHRLVAVLTDGTLAGGRYNPATGMFTFETTTTGEFTIVHVESLKRLNVVIGSATITDLAGNANTIAMDIGPVIVDGRTLLPVRFIAEMLGGQVSWNDAAREVTISIDGKTLSFVIGQTVSGMDVPSQIIDGRTMVPLRFVSEFFDAVVNWDANARSIEIIKM